MIIHLIGSLRDDVDTDAKYLRQVVNTVQDEGNVVSENWLEAAIVRNKKDVYIEDWKPFVQSNLDGIKRADLVIADLTYYTFAHGFLIAAALDNNKPVLALSREQLSTRSASGITSPLFSFEKYQTESDIDGAVRTFLKRNVVHTKDLRFNMFLTREIVQFLDEQSEETGVNRSEIIRKLIRNKVQEKQHND